MTRTPVVTAAQSDPDAYAALFGPVTTNKFGAKTVILDGYTFASKAEAIRYTDLKKLVARGEIEDLRVHARFPLEVNGHKVGAYTCDFSYRVKGEDAPVIEDVKSAATLAGEAFRLRSHIFYAVTKQVITCVNAKGTVLAILPKLPKPKAARKPRKETNP